MKYVRCDSHCKYPAYDKEEVDNLLKDKANNVDVYKKGDFAILTGEITLADGIGSITTDYPEGFTQDNCFVLSHGQSKKAETLESINFGYGKRPIDYTRGSITRNVALKSDNIEISIANSYLEDEGNLTYNYKILLMKIS